MSEAVQKVCPECGRVFEASPRAGKKVYCSAECRWRRRGPSSVAVLRQQLAVETDARRAAKRRRERMLKHRDAEFAKIGVRVVITKGGGGGHIERRGMVGGGCCAVNSAAFNPRPFDLRIFKP